MPYLVARVASRLKMQKEKERETGQEQEEEKETKVVEADHEPTVLLLYILYTSHLVSISSLQVPAPIPWQQLR